ncbi:hypothetical protein GYB22_13865 [bacterium]|nr:hypothetical protein [bacterium]
MHPKIWELLQREIEEGNQIVGFHAIGAVEGRRCISIELKYPFSNTDDLSEGLFDYVDVSSSGIEGSMCVGIEYCPVDDLLGKLKIKSVLRYTNKPETAKGDRLFTKREETFLRVLFLLLSIFILSVFMFPEFYLLLIKVLIPVLVLHWALKKYF